MSEPSGYDVYDHINKHITGRIAVTRDEGNLLFDSILLKKSSNEATSAKAGNIFAGEFFSHWVKSFIAFVLFFRYILFHLLSASSLVLIVFGQPFFTIDGGIFVRKN